LIQRSGCRLLLSSFEDNNRILGSLAKLQGFLARERQNVLLMVYCVRSSWRTKVPAERTKSREQVIWARANRYSYVIARNLGALASEALCPATVDDAQLARDMPVAR
jgi:hypothetical protein